MTNTAFNPAYVPASSTVTQPGVLLRVAKCPEDYGGSKDHIMWAPCGKFCTFILSNLFIIN